MANANDKQCLEEALTQLSMAFGEFSSALKKADRRAYEQWKAGGYIVSDNVVSMYPSAQEAVDQLEDCEDEDEVDDDGGIVKPAVEGGGMTLDEMRKWG